MRCGCGVCRVQGRFDEALKLDRELRRQINLVEDMS